MPKLERETSLNWDATVGIGKTGLVDAYLLHFDTGNPRFTPDKRPDENTDEAIVVEMARSADLSELVQSIGNNGYFNIEPLVVVVRGSRLVVLEGNRRLAALKVLNDSRLAERAKLTIPKFGDDVLKSMEKILVYRVEKEDDARNLIGYKHINGPQSWDAFAKAAFAAKWLDDQSNTDGSLSLVDIANRMGDSHATIHRMVTAYYVLMQAQREEIFLVENRYKRTFSFSHLYTGLAYVEFTQYIGMPKPDRKIDPSRDPVDGNHAGNLENLLRWLYGSKVPETRPVVWSQNPDLGRLRAVLKSKPGIQVLEKTGNLDNAEITATPRSFRFAKHIVEADNQLRLALDVLDGFDAQNQLELQDIVNSASGRVSVIKSRVDVQVTDHHEVSGGE